MRVTRDRRGVRVRDIMSRSVLAGEAGQTLSAAASAMRARRVGALVVHENARVVGIITERDLLRAIADKRQPAETVVAEYMTPDPLTVQSGQEADAARRLMLQHGIRHLPVLERGRLVGFLSVRDLLAVPRTTRRAVERW